MRPVELLIVTAVIELGAGVALLARPSSSVKRLLGSRLETAADRTLGRLAGAALLALGVACALACRDGQGPAARAVIGAMLAYNLGALVVLGIAGVRNQPVGRVLWPAVALHAIMTIWCGSNLV
jgi:hypothetical protein